MTTTTLADPRSDAGDATQTHHGSAETAPTGPVLDVVVPVYNEQTDLGPSVERLHAYLSRRFPYPFRITIADNASTDATPRIAERLVQGLDHVTYRRLEQKGRGRALAATWLASDARVLAYMDVDLSTDLDALLPLVAPLISGHSHLAIGSRLARGARVVRGPKREAISRCYNLILRGTLAAHFSDAQCGFKAIRADVARELVPLVADPGWFFDTELLVLAERSGLRVHEVPVDWIDDPDSRVDIVATATADLKGVARLLRDLTRGRIPTAEIRRRLVTDVGGPADPGGGPPVPFATELAWFAAIGVASTLAYLLAYLGLRTGLSPQASNLMALAVTAVGNTAAHRRFTFGVRGREGLGRYHLQGLAVFCFGLGVTAGSLAALHRLAPGAARAVEVAVLVAANVAATVVRFRGPPGVGLRPPPHRPGDRPPRRLRRPEYRPLLERSPAMTTVTDDTDHVRPAPPGAPTTPRTDAGGGTGHGHAWGGDGGGSQPDGTGPVGASDNAASAARALWERPALAAVLAVTAVLYLWGLGASGWANGFYSAAVQAGSVSWKAFLFGSSDAANSITVDKPPASLWVMALSVRLFGLSSWSILVPQALMGVGTVAAVWYAVRRWFSAGAALFAAIAMAVTPVAVLMFRFNNPDALLVLVMTLAAITTLRGIEDGRRRWALATGALVGIGFLTKQLQVMLIVPPFALAHLWAARGSIGRRVTDLLVAGAAMVASAGWWVALVELWPASSRPWIGGSQTNSILELTLGYNGLGRITGDEVGSVTGSGGQGGPGGRMWGATGITRMIDGVIGGQIAWLLPAALAALVASFWFTRRVPRTDLRRAGLLVWGGWLVVTALVFSFMAGIFHEYYTVALAPPIAALVGTGADLAWRHRHELAVRLATAGVVAASGLWAARLLGRATNWNAWLVPLVLVGGLGSAAALATLWHRRSALALGASLLGGAVLLTGPAAWSLQTAATPHTGSIVTAGPAVEGGRGGGPGGGPGAQRGGIPGGNNGNGRPGFPGPATGANGATTGPATGVGNGAPAGAGSTAGRRGGFPGGAGGGMGGGPSGGPGGLLDSTEPSAELTATLLEDADRYTWVAATVGANNAAGYQLATEEPVMPLGGFNGSDPSPTLEEFQAKVAAGEIHWFIEGGRIGAGNGAGNGSAGIAEWVAANFRSFDVGGTTLYDLTQPLS